MWCIGGLSLSARVGTRGREEISAIDRGNRKQTAPNEWRVRDDQLLPQEPGERVQTARRAEGRGHPVLDRRREDERLDRGGDGRGGARRRRRARVLQSELQRQPAVPVGGADRAAAQEDDRPGARADGLRVRRLAAHSAHRPPLLRHHAVAGRTRRARQAAQE